MAERTYLLGLFVRLVVVLSFLSDVYLLSMYIGGYLSVED
jgi:hypothetical protein